MLIVFMQSCGAFVIPLFLGGTGTVMLPVAIWEQMTVANDWPAGAVLAITLTALALAVLAIQLRFFNPLRGAGQP
jgi:ABC-type spermidine/putrescine transport system permease subunit I